MNKTEELGTAWSPASLWLWAETNTMTWSEPFSPWVRVGVYRIGLLAEAP